MWDGVQGNKMRRTSLCLISHRIICKVILEATTMKIHSVEWHQVKEPNIRCHLGCRHKFNHRENHQSGNEEWRQCGILQTTHSLLLKQSKNRTDSLHLMEAAVEVTILSLGWGKGRRWLKSGKTQRHSMKRAPRSSKQRPDWSITTGVSRRVRTRGLFIWTIDKI